MENPRTVLDALDVFANRIERENDVPSVSGMTIRIPRFRLDKRTFAGLVEIEKSVYRGDDGPITLPSVIITDVHLYIHDPAVRSQLGDHSVFRFAPNRGIRDLLLLRHGDQRATSFQNLRIQDPFSANNQAEATIGTELVVLFDKSGLIGIEIPHDFRAPVPLQFSLDYTVTVEVLSDERVSRHYRLPLIVHPATVVPEVSWVSNQDVPSLTTGSLHDLGSFVVRGVLGRSNYSVPHLGTVILQNAPTQFLDAIQFDDESKGKVVGNTIELPANFLEAGDRREYVVYFDYEKYGLDQPASELSLQIAEHGQSPVAVSIPPVVIPRSYLSMKFDLLTGSVLNQFEYSRKKGRRIGKLTLAHEGDPETPYRGVVKMEAVYPTTLTRTEGILELRSSSDRVRIERDSIHIDGLVNHEWAEVEILLNGNHYSLDGSTDGLDFELRFEELNVLEDEEPMWAARHFTVINPQSNNRLGLDVFRTKSKEVNEQNEVVWYTLERPVFWKKGVRKSNPTVFNLELGNQSRRNGGEGAVVIKNLTFELYTELQFETRRTSVAAAEVFEVEGSRHTNFRVSICDQSRLEERVFTFRENDDALVVRGRFLAEQIARMTPDEAMVGVVVSFDYLETDQFGSIHIPDERLIEALPTDQFRHKSFTIHFRLARDFGNEWVAFDFGTSAMVVVHSAGETRDDMRVVNFKDVQDIYNTEDDTLIVTDGDTPFLSSRLLLKKSGQGAMLSPDYHDALVQVSVPEQKYLINRAEGIPSLKSLIGLEYLSDLKGNLQDYKFIDAQGNPRADLEPLRISEIFQETYYNILNHFFLQTDFLGQHEENVNKIVLTVPNSFTPVHRELLRGIFRKTPALHERFGSRIKFVTESDAVMYYYIANWTTFNTERPAGEYGALKAGDRDEHVLVYDMGAGTLDLTYLKKRARPDARHGDTDEVEILGRFGRNTAGDYLDYVLARIIYRLYGEEKANKKSLVGEQLGNFGYFDKNPFAKRNRDIGFASEYKRFIRNEIKPAIAQLGDSGSVRDPIIKASDSSIFANDFRLDLGNVVTQPEFTEYLTENSDALFQKMFELIGQSIETAPVDTVIFSGRASQLGVLRDYVRLSLDKGPHDIQYYGVEQLAKDHGNQLLKSAVVRGAISYAAYFDQTARFGRSGVTVKDDRLKVRYGIAAGHLQRAGVPWKFYELLEAGTEMGPSGFRGEVTVPLGNVSHLYLVQSFLPASYDGDKKFFPPGELFDQNYLTIIRRFNRDSPALGGSYEVMVRLKIDRNEQLTFELVDAEDGHPLDDASSEIALQNNLKENETFQKSQWPYYE